MARTLSADTLLGGEYLEESRDLSLLFHQLTNQLGIILAHAELLESKALDDTSRARASQVVSSTLEAMRTTREIRRSAIAGESR